MATLIQLNTGTSVTVTRTFEVDGAPINVDSGTPVLTVVRPDGTAFTPLPTVETTWAGPPARTIGQYRFVLHPQADPVWLDYTLTGTIGGDAQTLRGRVEWVGAQLFTISQMRGLRVAGGTPFSDTATPHFDDQQIMDVRAATLDEFTQILGFSPVPRFYRELHDGDGSGRILLDELHAHHPPLSVKVNGAAESVSNYTLRPEGILQATSNYTAAGSFTRGSQNIAVEYVAGWDQVMGDGSNVAMLRTAMRLDPGISSAATSVVTPDGVSYSFDPAGQVTQSGRVRHFGVPAIDSWLNRWSQAGVAVA